MDFKLVNLQAVHFLEKVFTELNSKNFVLKRHWDIDHLCYRTTSQEQYNQLKSQFANFSILLIESEVGGRLISTFKLNKPIIYDNWTIDLIEIPAPKKGKIVQEGFEHFEVVCDLSFDEIKDLFKPMPFDDSGLSKEFNSELEYNFDGFAVKFHHLSIESVINIEKNSNINSALKKAKVFSALKSFYPLLAGTYPLNVEVKNSDFDILVSCKDLNLLKTTLIENYGSFQDFNLEEIIVNELPTVLSTFKFQEISFEIFGQQTNSVKQQAYCHFLIEERLLKIGGLRFAAKVKKLRDEGFKTEPAFAKVLGLMGDPYKELLSLQKKSNQELKTLLESIK